MSKIQWRLMTEPKYGRLGLYRREKAWHNLNFWIFHNFVENEAGALLEIELYKTRKKTKKQEILKEWL